MQAWEDSYSGQLRTLVGHRKLIIPSIRAIIPDEESKLLFIRRKDNGSWAMPAGSMELNESIYDCLCREVWEETGLRVQAATLIAIYTEPRFSTKNRYGDEYQGFEFLYRVDSWSGRLETETDETTDAAFYSLESLPPLHTGYWGKHHMEVIEDFKNFRGTPFIK